MSESELGIRTSSGNPVPIPAPVDSKPTLPALTIKRKRKIEKPSDAKPLMNKGRRKGVERKVKAKKAKQSKAKQRKPPAFSIQHSAFHFASVQESLSFLNVDEINTI